MKFFDPLEDIRVTRQDLRHWQQVGTTYFVTFRLADSLPTKMLRDLEKERAQSQQNHPPPLSSEDEAEYHKRFSVKLDHWLDEGHEKCILQEASYRKIIEEALHFFEGPRYELLANVIMPNHVHTSFSLYPHCSLEKVLFTWKRFTSGEIHKKLGIHGQSFWQHDYFDRLIRDDENLNNVIRYIRKNPMKTHLPESQYTFWDSSLAQTVQ